MSHFNWFLVIIECYEWLLCFLLKSTSEDIKGNPNKNIFVARNAAQVYRAKDLTRAYAEYYALQSFR